MTAEDEEFNRIEMESRIKQEYIRAMNREENNRMIGAHQDHVRRLMDELAIARVCIRELGDRLSRLEKPWVDLTKEECFELCVKHKDNSFSLLVAVQEKLMEKNNAS
jgi:hypothetical protein